MTGIEKNSTSNFSRRIVICICLFLFSVNIVFSQSNLRFNKDGKFKIVQFTDIHFQNDGSPRADSVLLLMRQIISGEKPDLVVLTGDIVSFKDTRNAWLTITKPMVEANVPFAVNFGNHDREYDLTNQEILELLQSLPQNLTKTGPNEVDGVGNFALEIMGSSKKEVAALIWCFDSHRSPLIEGMGGYDWVKTSQINWYKQTSANYAEQNTRALPALCFLHIPVPEYNEVLTNGTMVGMKGEKVCAPDVNSGLFTAMLESGDVMGMFCGHDHVNNYIGVVHGIALAYGQATGLQGYGKLAKGARVIEMIEGERSFNTWINTFQQDKNLWVNYPDSFRFK